MRKVCLLLIVIVALFNNLSAQTDPARDEQNLIFQYIDKSQIPSGYLDEYGPQVVDKNWLNGVLADSNRIYNIELFRYLYNDIENAKLYASAPTMTPLTSVNTAIAQANTTTSTPLVFLTGQYSILREDAIQQNLFTASNNQLFDVAGRTQSPYLLKNVFAASPVKQIAPTVNTLSLTYIPSLSYSNNGKAISQVWIDFLDGTGYRSVAANGSVSKTYTDSSGYKRFAIRVLYTNNTYNYCYSGQYVTVKNTTTVRYASFSQFDLANPAHTIPAVAGQHQTGKIYVRYSTKRNGTTLQGKMIKPLIIVEGYDIHDVAPKLQETNYDANDLLDEWSSLYRNTNYDFNKELDETAGYDLVFIEYYTMDYIENNAIMLQKAIQWVNSQKVAGSSQQNVVVGISLGGVLARYTLAKMTKELGTASTQSRLLLTHDSPHQGANVPLGFQHFLYDFGEAKIVRPLKDLSDELKQFYLLNQQPSTQQLLIARVTDANGTVAYNTFLSGAYRTMITFNSTHPQPSYQFKATAQGSQCSRYVMQPGTLLAYKDGNVATANFYWFAFRSKYKLTVQINALPAQGTSALISYVKMQRNIRLFFGAVGTGWKTTYEKTRYSPSNLFPWDAVPGGTQSASGRSGGSFSNNSTTPDPLKSGQTFFGGLWRYAVFPWFNVRSYLDVPFQQDIFSFVPLSSSLDIQNPTLSTFNQSYIFPVNGPSGSTSARYIAQEEFAGTISGAQTILYNLTHTDFTARNSQWMYSQMEGNAFNDCAAACTNLLTIYGKEPVCPSSTFTVLGLPPGASVTWLVSPTTVATVNPSTGVVTRVSNGSATLTATVTSCGFSVPISKTIQVGGPPVINISYTPVGSCNGSYQTWLLQATSPNTVTSWQWTVDNPSSGSWYIDNPNSSSTYVDVSGGGGISVTATSGCGTSKSGVTIWSNCNELMASPNPTTDDVNISIVQSKDIASSNKKKAIIYQINVTDQSGNLKKQYKYSSGVSNTMISLRGMPKGMYVIQAFDGVSWSSVQVIKK